MSDRIAEIKARLAAATPGPWKIYDGWGPANDGLYRATRIGSSSDTVLAADDDEIKATEGDFELIAMASDDIAYLLAEVERLRAVLQSKDALSAVHEEFLRTYLKPWHEIRALLGLEPESVDAGR